MVEFQILSAFNTHFKVWAVKNMYCMSLTEPRGDLDAVLLPEAF